MAQREGTVKSNEPKNYYLRQKTFWVVFHKKLSLYPCKEQNMSLALFNQESKTSVYYILFQSEKKKRKRRAGKKRSKEKRERRKKDERLLKETRE